MPREIDVATPLLCGQARRLAVEILTKGSVSWTGHALDEMKADDLTKNDVVNGIRGGRIDEPAELRGASWTYRIQTERLCVVVAFRSARELAVVTAWRKKRRAR